MDQAVTLFTFIRQLSTSNPGRNTNRPPKRLRDSVLSARHAYRSGGSRVVTDGRTDMMKLTVGAELLQTDGQT